MIDTNKFIPKRKERVRLSTMTTIGLIKKDVVKIDSLLKEKLVLSKVRYGILRKQNERETRSGRESALESKKSRPQDYSVNLKSNASSTSSKTRFDIPKLSYKCFPMPKYCDP